MASDDDRRFETAYRRHYTAVVEYVLRRVRDVHDAQDITAATFATAWRQLARLPEEPHTRAWLFDIAHDHVSNHWRAQRRSARRLWAVFQFGSRPEVSEEHSSDHLVDEDALVIRRYRRLPTGDQEVLRLIYWDGLSHAEAAAVLGCSQNALALRLSRARRSLRGLVEDVERGMSREEPS